MKTVILNPMPTRVNGNSLKDSFMRVGGNPGNLIFYESMKEPRFAFRAFLRESKRLFIISYPASPACGGRKGAGRGRCRGRTSPAPRWCRRRAGTRRLPCPCRA